MTVTLPPRPGTRTGRYVAVPADAPPLGRASARPPGPAPGASAPAPERGTAGGRRYGVAVTLGLIVVMPLAALVVGLLLGVLLGLVAVAQRAGDGAPSAAVPPQPTVAAAPALTAAFPDLTTLGAACTPYDAGAHGYTTSTGARAVAVVRCDHSAVVPGGWVYYTQWPTAADARQWHADQVRWGTSLDGRARWHAAGQDQGPWHTRSGTDGTVYATAAYADRAYGFDVVTRSPQDTQRLFPAMRLLPATTVPA